MPSGRALSTWECQGRSSATRRCVRKAAAVVVSAVSFLASDQADCIHGQHLMVDGGMSFSLWKQMPSLVPEEAQN